MASSDSTRDGGHAFPMTWPDAAPDPGMSLRQWYVGQAIAGLCANSIPGSQHHPENLVAEAFQYADQALACEAAERSMLKAREASNV